MGAGAARVCMIQVSLRRARENCVNAERGCVRSPTALRACDPISRHLATLVDARPPQILIAATGLSSLAVKALKAGVSGRASEFGHPGGSPIRGHRVERGYGGMRSIGEISPGNRSSRSFFTISKTFALVQTPIFHGVSWIAAVPSGWQLPCSSEIRVGCRYQQKRGF